MRKIFPFFIVIVFWAISLWGQNNPKVGNVIVVIGIVVIVPTVILLTKKILNYLIANSK